MSFGRDRSDRFGRVAQRVVPPAFEVRWPCENRLIGDEKVPLVTGS